MRLNHPFLRLKKRYCAETIAAEVAAIPPSAWVPHPGKIPGNDALLLITPHGQITNGFVGPMMPTEHLRKCRYIMEIMADLGGVWGRSRLMGLAPGARVPDHVDVNYYWRTHLRIHIPVITTPRVRFSVGADSVHMAPGECWTFDSFRMHNVHNGGTEKRIHLVLDTVGSEKIWDLVEEAQLEGTRPEPPAEPLRPGQRQIEGLAFEQVNAPTIMSPWEVRSHLEFVLEQLPPSTNAAAAARRLDRFANGWTAAWAQFGPSDRGVPAYQALIARVQEELRRLGGDTMLLPNEVPLSRALNELIFQIAVPARRPQQPVVSGFGLTGIPARRLAS